MTIPTTLSARRTELERQIKADEQEIQALDENANAARQALRVARAELYGITQAIEATRRRRWHPRRIRRSASAGICGSNGT